MSRVASEALSHSQRHTLASRARPSPAEAPAASGFATLLGDSGTQPAERASAQAASNASGRNHNVRLEKSQTQKSRVDSRDTADDMARTPADPPTQPAHEPAESTAAAVASDDTANQGSQGAAGDDATDAPPAGALPLPATIAATLLGPGLPSDNDPSPAADDRQGGDPVNPLDQIDAAAGIVTNEAKKLVSPPPVDDLSKPEAATSASVAADTVEAAASTSPTDKSMQIATRRDADIAAPKGAGIGGTGIALSTDGNLTADQAPAAPVSGDDTDHAPALHAGAANAGETPAKKSDAAPPKPQGEDQAGGPTDAAKQVPDSSQLQGPAQPIDRLSQLTHLTPAATAAHAGAATTAETSAAVPVAGLAIEIAARAQSGNNRFEIRLDPPELGRIDVRLDIDHRGNVTSRLVVEKSETLDLLRRDAPELERALQQAGLKTSDSGLQFTLRDQSFAGRDDNRPAPDMARVVVPDSELAPIETARSGYGRWPRLDGGVDIRV